MKLAIGEGLEWRRLFLLALFLASLGLAFRTVMHEKETDMPVAIAEESKTDPVSGRGEKIFVYITGAVRAPGVYEIRKGARVHELLKAADGHLPYADLDRVNLSEALVDEAQIHIPGNPRPFPTGGTRLVNINTADEKELETLPGIGPVTAKKILDFRNAHGHFKEKQELKQVPSIGDVKYKGLADRITL